MTSDSKSPASAKPAPASLLPEGFRDRLPPYAARQSALCRSMLDVMAGYGYERVAPPLAEYESTLAHRLSENARGGMMRVTDPATGQTLAIRSDITVQIGRMAGGRLQNMPRPLRLSYLGQIMRLRASPLRPDRELSQLGAELIGSDSVAAVAEIVSVAVESLEAAGVKNITVDLTLPDLVETLAAGAMPIADGKLDAVRSELDMKDAGALQRMGADSYLPLLEATGAFAPALDKLKEIDAGSQLAGRIAALEDIAARIEKRATVTLDPTERHGFEYQSWFGFTLYADGYQMPLGRGGTYGITHEDGREEKATGFSLYPDTLGGAAQPGAENKRLFLPIGTDAGKAARLRSDGWITVFALDEGDDPKLLDCDHILHNGRATPV